VEKRWTLLPKDDNATQKLKASLQINETICQLLTQRGIADFENAKAFFRPSLDALHSPWLMKDMKKAVNRLLLSFEKKEKILVFGDYDVDGTTAVASFFQFLNSIYPSTYTDFYIPNRYSEGYGVSKQGIDFAKENNFTLIVCLDCGIKSVALIDYAKTLGIDFIIGDHHLPGKELPNASAILNPKQSDCSYPFKELCGCGIGFKLMMALAETLKLESSSYEKFLDLVATAIAADIVPMVGENRILAYHGLKKINSNPSLGIKTIIELSTTQPPLSIHNVVFMIAPRVNAAGRMDDARKVVRLFIEQDPKIALELGAILQTDNSERREIDKSITEEALDMIAENKELQQRKSCVLYGAHWHKGVVGIVASRVIETHYKPTVILTESNGFATGSARSIKGFNLYEAIYECREYLTAFGGHFAAAGLSLLPENVEAFSNKFEEIVSSTITEASLTPEIIIDAEIDLSEANQSFYNILHQMEPFGPENMRPVFIARNVRDTGYATLLKDQHIKFEISHGASQKVSGIGFNMPQALDLIADKKPFDVVFTIDENEFKGNKKIQLKVIDIRTAQTQ
jgi:single-stranded-DNA-specific exonuclease